MMFGQSVGGRSMLDTPECFFDREGTREGAKGTRKGKAGC